MISKKIALGGALLIVLLQALYVWAFVGAEHTVYYWDHAMYHNMVRALFGGFNLSFGNGVDVIQQSQMGDYPLYFGLPDVLTFALFGDSRLVFILTNFLFYVVAQEAALALVLKRLYGFSFSRSLLVATVGAFLVPSLWVPLLEGYPDNSAAAALTLALALTLAVPKGSINNIKRGALFGLMLGLAVLFRRHYAYAALALVFVSGVFDLFALYVKKAWGEAKDFVARYATAGIVAVGLLFVAAPDFLRNAVTVNYGTLYKSYEVSAAAFVHYVFYNMGFLLVAVLLAGLYVSARYVSKEMMRVAVWFVAWLIVWSFGPSEAAPHYVLQILPICLICAAVGLGIFLYKKQIPYKKPLAIALAALIIGNAVYAMWGAESRVRPYWMAEPLSVFTAPYPPVVRQDFEALENLAKYIRQTNKNAERVAALGSSVVINQDIIRAFYTDVLKDNAGYMTFIQTPEIDHKQEAPYDVYASARIFIVPEPAQYHLDPAGQKVVTALAAQFPPDEKMSDLWQKDDKEFELEAGVKISIWRRKGEWKPALLQKRLENIREIAGEQMAPTISKKRDWVFVKEPLMARGMTMTDGMSHAQAYFVGGLNEMTLFFDQPIRSKIWEFSTILMPSPECHEITGKISFVREDGSPFREDKISFQDLGRGAQKASVIDDLKSDQVLYAFVKFTQEGSESRNTLCSVVFNNITMQ